MSLVSMEAQALVLPLCVVAPEEINVTADEVLENYGTKLERLGGEVSLYRLKEHERNPKFKLSGKERAAFAAYGELNSKILFWKYVISLKSDLIDLYDGDMDAAAALEADSMAKIIIETIYGLSQTYRIGSLALFRNFLINIGTKKEGFCYHYVEGIRAALSVRQWQKFDLHWGAAWEGDFRENNALVITAKGAPFEKGIAVDSWRTAGRPFWTKVKGDRFPWVEVDY